MYFFIVWNNFRIFSSVLIVSLIEKWRLIDLAGFWNPESSSCPPPFPNSYERRYCRNVPGHIICEVSRTCRVSRSLVRKLTEQFPMFVGVSSCYRTGKALHVTENLLKFIVTWKLSRLSLYADDLLQGGGD